MTIIIVLLGITFRKLCLYIEMIIANVAAFYVHIMHLFDTGSDDVRYSSQLSQTSK